MMGKSGNGEAITLKEVLISRYAIRCISVSLRRNSQSCCPKASFKEKRLACAYYTHNSIFLQPSISLAYTIVSFVYLMVYKKSIADAVDIMIDVIIFGINIVPISFCFSVYGPM